MLKVKTSCGVWSITTDHSGKMKGMWSTSTSCKHNLFCQKSSQILNSVCAACYAMKQLSFRANQEKPYLANYELLTKNIIPFDEIPELNCLYFRIESFGDIENVTQAINYLNLVIKNPEVKFAWFTKNPLIIVSALHELGFNKEKGKPENLNIVLSSLMINKKSESNFWFVDKIFTVYDKEVSKTKTINCGAKNCFKCKLCYKKNGVNEINETLK